MNDGKQDNIGDKFFTPDGQSERDGQQYVNQLNETIAKNADALDKLIITLSSGFLAISITFVDKVVPLGTAIFKPILILSWLCFVVSIILNVISFFVADHECNRRKLLAGEFYFKGNKASGIKLRNSTTLTHVLNYFTAGFYVLGTLLITAFVSSNIYFKGGCCMAEQKKVTQPQKTKEFRTDSIEFSEGRKAVTESVESAVPPPIPVDSTIVNKTDIQKE